MTYRPTTTGLPLVAPYDDILSEAAGQGNRDSARRVRPRARPAAHSQVGAGRSDESQVLMAAALEAWRNLP
jgi:hypothetical protein